MNGQAGDTAKPQLREAPSRVVPRRSTSPPLQPALSSGEKLPLQILLPAEASPLTDGRSEGTEDKSAAGLAKWFI